MILVSLSVNVFFLILILKTLVQHQREGLRHSLLVPTHPSRWSTPTMWHTHPHQTTPTPHPHVWAVISIGEGDRGDAIGWEDFLNLSSDDNPQQVSVVIIITIVGEVSRNPNLSTDHQPTISSLSSGSHRPRQRCGHSSIFKRDHWGSQGCHALPEEPGHHFIIWSYHTIILEHHIWRSFYNWGKPGCSQLEI